MKIKVYPLQSDDRNQWEKLYHCYAEFYEMPMTEEILNNVWSWIFSEEKFYCALAKNSEGQALGLMHYREMPCPLRGAKAGFLDDLYVDTTFRGTGTVDALFNYLNQQAKTQGWRFVRWITADNNYRGRNVYDKIATKTHWVTYELTTNQGNL